MAVSKFFEVMDIVTVNTREDGGQVIILSKNDKFVTFEYPSGLSPLYRACGIDDNLQAVTKLLVRPEIDVNATCTSSNCGWTSVHVACNINKLQVVDKLLQSPGIDVNVKSFVGHTPLHLACLKNHDLIVRKLLASPGIDVNIKDVEGFTPLMECVRRCNKLSLNILLDDPRVNLDIKDSKGRGLEVKVRTSSYYKCLEMIKNERLSRENVEIEKEKKNQAGSVGTHFVDIDKIGRKISILNVEENGQHQITEVTEDGKLQKKEKVFKSYCARPLCPNKGRGKCYRCRAVFYCHQDCLTEDWPHHKMFCDYVYEANKVPQDSTTKNTSENGNTREEVD